MGELFPVVLVGVGVFRIPVQLHVEGELEIVGGDGFAIGERGIRIDVIINGPPVFPDGPAVGDAGNQLAGVGMHLHGGHLDIVVVFRTETVVGIIAGHAQGGRE